MVTVKGAGPSDSNNTTEMILVKTIQNNHDFFLTGIPTRIIETIWPKKILPFLTTCHSNQMIGRALTSIPKIAPVKMFKQ